MESGNAAPLLERPMAHQARIRPNQSARFGRLSSTNIRFDFTRSANCATDGGNKCRGCRGPVPSESGQDRCEGRHRSRGDSESNRSTLVRRPLLDSRPKIQDAKGRQANEEAVHAETVAAYTKPKLTRLGGYLARAHNRPPGNTVIWRGMSRLTDIELGIMIGVQLVGNWNELGTFTVERLFGSHKCRGPHRSPRLVPEPLDITLAGL